jgi:hypothetical protein
MVTEEQKQFLIENYPSMGKEWCCQQLNLREGQVRHHCSKLKLKLDINSEFFKEFQEKAAKSKVGKKKPIHSELMRQKFKEGLLGEFGIMTNEKKREISQRTKKYIRENGHPKGMLGKKHNGKTKSIMSKNSKEMWENADSYVNSQEYRQYLSDKASKQTNFRLADNSSSIYSRSKKGTITIGEKTIFARSRWEANIAAYFEFLKKNNEIKDWEHEPTTFWFLEIKRGIRSYKPDFLITRNDGTQYYEEVKGWMDDKSKTKLNRMRIYYPKIDIRVLGEDRYKAISKNKSVIPNWGILD